MPSEDSPPGRRPASALNLTHLLDSLPNLVWSARPTGDIDYICARHQDYTGLAKREDGTWDWLPAFHPDDLHATKEAWDRSIATGERFQVEHRMNRANVGFRWHLSRAVLISEPNQPYPRWFGTSTDIDEQAQSREALVAMRWSSERAQASGGVGLWEWDLLNHRLYLSDSIWAIYGIKPHPGLTPPELWAQAVHPLDAPLLQEKMTRILESRELSYHAEYRIVRPEGRVVWIESNARIERDADGKPTRIAGTHYDITRRKELEEALGRSEESFRSLLDAIPHLVWTTAGDGSDSTCNARMQRKLSTDPATHAPRSWIGLELVHPEDRDRTEVAWAKALTSRQEWEIEHRLAIPPGGFAWHITRAVPLKDEFGNVLRWYGTTTNIEAQKSAEAVHQLDAHERREELREAYQRIEELLFTLAHDLRAPARAMQAFAELVLKRDGMRLSDDGRDLMMRIQRSADYMDRLVVDAVELTSMPKWKPKLEPISVGAVWSTVCKLEAAEIESSGAMVLVADPLPTVLADAEGLRAVLRELLSNALRFSRDSEPPTVTIQAIENPDTWKIVIADNGCGISGAQAKDLFAPFYRARPGDRTGTGFGLAFVKKRMELMKGRVGVEPSIGSGSRFFIELPKVAANPPP